MLGFVPGWAEFSARRTLAHLQAAIGGPGMAAAASVPGLAAIVDQHAAAVRDILTVGVEESTDADGAILLANYARGLLDEARDKGWQFRAPAIPTGWAGTDWLTARLLAVCELARRIDQPPLPAGLIGFEPAG